MSDLAAALAAMLEQIEPIREAAKGYREQLARDGWSPTAAERMAMELHNRMVCACFAASGGGGR